MDVLLIKKSVFKGARKGGVENGLWAAQPGLCVFDVRDETVKSEEGW